MQESLLRDMQRLLDIEAIKQLKARYCQYADSGKHAAEFAGLFTEDAVLDEAEDGCFTGRSRIQQMYVELWPFFTLNQHLVFNPIIEIHKDTASGEWRLLQLCTTKHPGGDKAFWSCGFYQERYVRIGNEWKFQHVKAGAHFCCDYADGWASLPQAELLPAEALSQLGLV